MKEFNNDYTPKGRQDKAWELQELIDDLSQKTEKPPMSHRLEMKDGNLIYKFNNWTNTKRKVLGISSTGNAIAQRAMINSYLKHTTDELMQEYLHFIKSK